MVDLDGMFVLIAVSEKDVSLMIVQLSLCKITFIPLLLTAPICEAVLQICGKMCTPEIYDMYLSCLCNKCGDLMLTTFLYKSHVVLPYWVTK